VLISIPLFVQNSRLYLSRNSSYSYRFQVFVIMEAGIIPGTNKLNGLETPLKTPRLVQDFCL